MTMVMGDLETLFNTSLSSAALTSSEPKDPGLHHDSSVRASGYQIWKGIGEMGMGLWAATSGLSINCSELGSIGKFTFTKLHFLG